LELALEANLEAYFLVLLGDPPSAERTVSTHEADHLFTLLSAPAGSSTVRPE
jgi:hypothetical protein